jgi:SPOR domain
MLPAPTPARGYIRAYLLTWGVLASAGLGYLGSLAWQPDLFRATPATPAPSPAEVEEGLRLANHALTDVGNARREIGEVRRDLGELLAAVAEHDEQDKRVESRIVALEERIATPPIAPAAPPAADKVAEKEKAKADKPHKTCAARPLQRATSEPQPTPAHRDAAPLATGSIGSPAITFGAPVVTPSPAPPYAVQLAAGPSLEAIRQSWSQLRERHAASLSALEPHVVPPRADGTGHFRLVAGPLPTRADAKRLCAELCVGRQGCFATTFIGQPL